MVKSLKASHLLFLALTVLSIAVPIDGMAQTVRVQRDKQKEKQLRSMEVGPWDFAPDWYYYFLHRKYSGAKAVWQWHGLESGYHVEFHEDKSNVKRINPTRVASEEVQRMKVSEVEDERKKLEELCREDLANQADRMIDASYPIYKDEFNRMQDVISEGLLYCMQKSHGELSKIIDELTRRNDIVCSNVAYIRKTGVGYELSNAKRQAAYEDAKTEMSKIHDDTVKLVYITQYFYK